MLPIIKPSAIIPFFSCKGEELTQSEALAISEYLTKFPLRVKAVDEGIGSYEFWGAIGHDTRPALEVTTPDCVFGVVMHNATFAEAMDKITNISESVTFSDSASDTLDHHEISGEFIFKLFDIELTVDPTSQTIVSANLSFAWVEV